MLAEKDIDLLLAKCERLQAMLQGTPEILELLRQVNKQHGQQITLTDSGDKLLLASEVLEILRISKSTLKYYVDTGLLQPVYTPPAGRAKYWLSAVRALPQTREVN